jgi:hypothetical protein
MVDDLARRETESLPGGDPADEAASQRLLDALHKHRDQVGGSAAIPLEDRQLNAKIMAEARSRSAEISSQRQRNAEQPMAWWVWALWILAIAGFALGWWLLG